MATARALTIQSGVYTQIGSGDTLDAGAGIKVAGDTTTGRLLVNDGTKFVPLAGPTLNASGQITASGQIETYAAWEGRAADSSYVGGGCSYGKAFPSTPSSFTFTVLDSNNLASGPFSYQPTAYGTGVYIGVTTTNALAYFFTRVQVS